MKRRVSWTRKRTEGTRIHDMAIDEISQIERKAPKNRNLFRIRRRSPHKNDFILQRPGHSHIAHYGLSVVDMYCGSRKNALRKHQRLVA